MKFRLLFGLKYLLKCIFNKLSRIKNESIISEDEGNFTGEEGRPGLEVAPDEPALPALPAAPAPAPQFAPAPQLALPPPAVPVAPPQPTVLVAQNPPAVAIAHPLYTLVPAYPVVSQPNVVVNITSNCKHQSHYNHYPAEMYDGSERDQADPRSAMIPAYLREPAHQQKIEINTITFMSVVKLVELDENNSYRDQKICLYCSQEFSKDVETRILPCLHAFHGNCAHIAIAVKNNKICPVCKTKYF